MTSLTDLNNAIAEAGEVPCQSAPDIFFTDPEQINFYVSTRDAVKLCQTCPVINECLSYALDNNEREGVWGGMSPTMRVKTKRAHRRGSPACGSALDELAS
jgi:WhiB family transcriptional regulator, redox-sensing transcriptional regulator